jgi:hypothetical protein
MQCLLPYWGGSIVPYFWDMTPDTLPRPDLNPLANPALERNLNRWAEVYFGNPPGKREEAVKRLLQEIKDETSEILLAEQARRRSSPEAAKERAAEARTTEARTTKTRSTGIGFDEIRSGEIPDVRCSLCQHQNPARQRFCGQCGAAVSPLHSGSENEPAFAARRTSTEAPPADSEVQWLRERALNHLYEAEGPAWRGWKYVLGGLVVALAGFAYLQWNFNHPIRVGSPASYSAPRMTTAASPHPANKPSTAAIPRPPEPIASVTNSTVHMPSTPRVSEAQPAVVTPRSQTVRGERTEQTGIQSASQSASQKSSLVATTTMPKTLESGDGGSADLLLAQRYLGGSMGVRDSAEAAKLLWKAVGKQNATAAILLSGLYARGDGVPKSCDQARLLLVAATKQGARQAAEQLRDLERRGCQ